MHTKLIENRNLAWVGGIVSHYRQPQCVADVDLWLSLGVCWIKGLVNEGVVWGGGGSGGSEATWVQAEEGALDWPWHATKLGGNTLAMKMRLGQHQLSSQCAYFCLLPTTPTTAIRQAQANGHNMHSIMAQVECNRVALKWAQERERDREKENGRQERRVGKTAAAFRGDFKFWGMCFILNIWHRCGRRRDSKRRSTCEREGERERERQGAR